MHNNPMAVISRDIDSPTIMECAHGPQQQQLQGQQQRNAHSYDSFVSVEMPWGIVELSWLVPISSTLQGTHQQWTTSDTGQQPLHEAGSGQTPKRTQQQ